MDIPNPRLISNADHPARRLFLGLMTLWTGLLGLLTFQIWGAGGSSEWATLAPWWSGINLLILTWLLGVYWLGHGCFEWPLHQNVPLFFDAYPRAVLLVDGAGQIVQANLRARILFGMTMDRPEGQPLSRVIPGWQLPQHIQHAQASQRFGQDGEILAKRSSGTHFPVSMAIAQARLNSQTLWILDLEDISERVAEETALRFSEQRHRSLVQTSFDWAWELDAQCCYRYVSDRVTDLLGYRPDELLGHPRQRFMPPEEAERVSGMLNAMIEQRVPFQHQESIYLHKDGRPVHFETSGLPMWTEDGVFLGLRGNDRDITTRKLAEETQARLAAIVASTEDAIISRQMDGTITSWNQGAEKLFGYTGRDVIGRSINLLYPPGGRQEEHKVLERLAQGEVVGHFETVRKRRDGSLVHISITLSPLKDASGQWVGVAMIARDITQQKLTESALHDAQRVLQRALRLAKMDSWYANPQAGTLTINPGGADILGWPPGSHPLSRLVLMVHPEDREDWTVAWNAAIGGHMPLNIEIRLQCENHTRWVHFMAEIERDADGHAIQANGMTQDITDIRVAQDILIHYGTRLEDEVAMRTRALREAEEHTRLVLDSSAGGLFGLDLDGRLTFMNPAACAILGHTEESICGQPFLGSLQGVPEDGSTALILESIRLGQRFQSDSEAFLDAQGRAIPVLYATNPMIHDQHLMGGVVSFLDITSQKEAEVARESARQEVERLARLRSDFLANMSHEIRTPLNGILGLAQVGLRTNPGPRVQEIFSQILDSGQLLLNIVNDILDFSKIEAGKFNLDETTMQIGELIERTVFILAGQTRDKGLQLVVEEKPGLPEQMLGDELRLSQILLNLLGNAIKFTPSGTVRLTLATIHGQLRLSVADTGIGINPRQIERLFLPFEQANSSTTRRFGGTGLGLAICQRLVDMMGGSIEVRSQEGIGSEFIVTIPLREARGTRQARVLSSNEWINAPREALPTGPWPARLSGLSILAAEDLLTNRMVLHHALEPEGCRLEIVENGQQLIERLRADGPQAWDLILTDIQMPELDGYAVAEQVRAMKTDLPVIGVTAYALPEERQRMLEAGMVDQVTKPFEIDTLVKSILQYAGRGGAEPRPDHAPPSMSPQTQATPPVNIQIRQVDWAQLEQRFGNDHAFVVELAISVLPSFLEALNELRKDLETDTPGQPRLCHRIKGMAANFLATWVIDAATLAEQAAHQNLPEWHTLGHNLQIEAEELARQLESIIIRSKTSSP